MIGGGGASSRSKTLHCTIVKNNNKDCDISGNNGTKTKVRKCLKGKQIV
jgi:hypothetical protein